MCKMYFSHLTIAVLICAGFTITFANSHNFHLNRVLNYSDPLKWMNKINATIERGKRTLLYLVPEEQRNEDCINTGNNNNSTINNCKPAEKIARNSNTSSWIINNDESRNESAKKFKDYYEISPSNQIQAIHEYRHKKPLFQTVPFQNIRETLKDILLSKYPHQKNNIENFFARLQESSPILQSNNFRNKIASQLDNVLRKTFKENDRRMIDNSSSSKNISDNQMINNTNSYKPENKSSQPAITIHKRGILPFIDLVNQNASTTADHQMVRIIGRAVLPNFIDSSNFASTQQSKINIPFASNVNFDQRVFLLNKNPYIPTITANQQNMYAQYPNAVSLYNLINSNFDSSDNHSPTKFLCIKRFEDEKVGQKLFNVNECVKLYNQQLCSSSNSKENCFNLDSSMPIEFNERKNANLYDSTKEFYLKNYNNNLNNQNVLSNSGINGNTFNRNYHNLNAEVPYIVTNQHVISSLPKENAYNILLSNLIRNQLYNQILPNARVLFCYTTNEQGLILSIHKCDDMYKHSVEFNQEGSNNSKNKLNNATKNKLTESKVSNNNNNIENENKFKTYSNTTRYEAISTSAANSSTAKEISKTVKNISLTTVAPKIVTNSHRQNKSSASTISVMKHSEKSKTYYDRNLNEQNVKLQKHNFEASLNSNESKTVDIIYLDDHEKYHSEISGNKVTKKTDHPTIASTLDSAQVNNSSTKKVKTKNFQMSTNQLVLPYNLTTLDLHSFPCTKHLVTTTPQSDLVTSSRKIQLLLRTIIKHVINEIVSKQREQIMSIHKVTDLNIENSSEAYVVSQIVDTPVLKKIFENPQVETLILNNVQSSLDKLKDLQNYVSKSSITENIIRTEIKNFVQKISSQSKTSAEEKHKLVSNQLMNEKKTQIKEITEKDIPSNFLLSTLHNMISQLKIEKSALTNEIVQKIIVKTVHNLLMASKNIEKMKIMETEIWNALHHLIASQLETQMLVNKNKTNHMKQSKNESIFSISSKGPTTSSLIMLKPSQHVKNDNFEMSRSEKNIYEDSSEKTSEVWQKLTNEELYDHISSTIKSLKHLHHTNSSEISTSKSENIDEILSSIEKNPIKYYSQTDRIVDYIKNNRNNMNHLHNVDKTTVYSSEDSHSTEKMSDEQMQDTINQSVYQKQNSKEMLKHMNSNQSQEESHTYEKYSVTNTYNKQTSLKSAQSRVNSNIIKPTQAATLKPSRMNDSAEDSVSKMNSKFSEFKSWTKGTSLEETHESYEEDSILSEQHLNITQNKKHKTELTNKSKEMTHSNDDNLVQQKYKDLSQKDYSTIDHNTITNTNILKNSREYQKVNKNEGFEEKLFTVSSEGINEDKGTIRYRIEEDSSVLSLVTEVPTEVIAARPTPSIKRHSNEKTVRKVRTTNPSTIYDDEEFHSYSTSIAMSPENYDDKTHEYSTDVSIPSAYDINRSSGIKSQISEISVDYHEENEDLSNQSLNSNEITRETFDDVTSYTEEDSVIFVKTQPEMLKYKQEPTRRVEKYVTKKLDYANKTNCNQKSEEEVTVDITKINEEFSSTTHYTTSYPSTTKSIAKKNKHRISSIVYPHLDQKESKGHTYTNYLTTTTLSPKPKPITEAKKQLKTNNRNSLYIGKLVPQQKTDVMDYLNGVDLFYVGDGVRLPLTIRRLPDGTFSLSLSDAICEQILKTKCCCLAKDDKKTLQKETINKREFYREQGNNKKKRARRSHEPFKILSEDGLNIDFHYDGLASLNKEYENTESIDIDDVPEEERSHVLLNAIDNLKDLTQNEINEVIHETIMKYSQERNNTSQDYGSN